MFAFVSAFPKSLHRTDEAQQAETVLSAVLSIYMYISSLRWRQKHKLPTRNRLYSWTSCKNTNIIVSKLFGQSSSRDTLDLHTTKIRQELSNIYIIQTKHYHSVETYRNQTTD